MVCGQCMAQAISKCRLAQSVVLSVDIEQTPQALLKQKKSARIDLKLRAWQGITWTRAATQTVCGDIVNLGGVLSTLSKSFS